MVLHYTGECGWMTSWLVNGGTLNIDKLSRVRLDYSSRFFRADWVTICASEHFIDGTDQRMISLWTRYNWGKEVQNAKLTSAVSAIVNLERYQFLCPRIGRPYRMTLVSSFTHLVKHNAVTDIYVCLYVPCFCTLMDEINSNIIIKTNQ